MPGIVGLITKEPRHWAEPQLLNMVAAQKHESFYETGTWVDESLGMYVGWTARSNSFSGGMPLHNERRDISLIFSGEEYADPETVRHLKERGHTFNPNDSSYLVHLYEENPDFPSQLNGMFHGLLANRTSGTAMLFNDRFGMHRIYCHESKQAFYFASEAKSILAVRPELRSPDPQSLGEFLAFGCVLEDRTIFKDIRALPAASAWVFRGGAIEQKNTYFQPHEWEAQSPLEPEHYYQELRDVLSRNLPRYFTGSEQVGMTLTGGLDTRVIMALCPPAPKSLRCYTFGGMYRDCQDVKVARRVADVCKQTHEVITVGNEFLSKFPYYAERSTYFTEGSVDISRCSDLYVSEKARALAPVKVVGTYGSEVIRHAVMFKPRVPTPGIYSSDFLAYIDQAGPTYSQFRNEHPVTFAAFRQSPWYHHGILALEQSQLSVRSPFLDNDFVRTVFRAPKVENPADDVRVRMVQDKNPVLAQMRTDRGVGTNFLSRAFLEFTVKAEYAYDYGMPQWIARIDHVFSGLHFERLFLGRQKLLHFRLWYRDNLSQYVRQMLLDPLTLSRPYLKRGGVEAIVQHHLKGNRNYTTEIHKLITLELLHRLFFDPR